MAQLLIVYGTSEGQTEKVAHRLRDRLDLKGHALDAYRADRVPEDLDPLDYDGVLVGGSIHAGQYQKPLLAWVQAHAPSLGARPSALFTVCMRVAVHTDEARREVDGYVAGLVRETSWQPAEAVAFAGALRYSAYNFFLRWMMKRITRKDAAHLPDATDTSRDHEFTDWAAVDAFADAFAHQLIVAEAQRPTAAAQGTPLPFPPNR